MGTILKDKFNFDRLDGIREAYSEAFHTDGSAISAVVQDKALDALSVLRNVIVHRNGVADETYVRRAKSLQIPQLSSGERLQLTGELTVQTIESVVSCGGLLLKVVSDWVSAHPV